MAPFFSKLGFKCPEDKGEADFLQDITIEKGQRLFRKDPTGKHDYMTASVRSPWPFLPLSDASLSALIASHTVTFYTYIDIVW